MGMGHLRVCYPNGDISREDRPSPLSLSNADHPCCCSIATHSWKTAEETAHPIVWSVQPTLDANTKRKEVIHYIQRLIQDGLGYQVFPYGSVPLKTYLPDGDIDLTTLGSPSIEDTLVSDVHAILKGEEHNKKAPYEVKDVHYIDAEVKLVKCLVENIVVDISFNQLGGLCTLCFLEQVDRRVGKDHLFKCSIILIKAWCYYESRILGAHHGLISTYTLETLVLYIFHLFHSSLNGPIAVLYRFLDYFSKFDWENYCISLKGPLCKSSLPDIVAEVPVNTGNDPLLSEEFLRKCINMFSFPSRGVETNSQLFPLRHLNIIDPLKENNNLGRSVNRGNYYRIRSALKYGAHKLGQILLLPRERIADELVKFFANTLERQRSNHLSSVQNPSSTSDARGSVHVMPAPRSSMCTGNYMLEKQMSVGSSNKKISSTASAGSMNKLERFPFNILSSQVALERKPNGNRNSFSVYFNPEDAKEFVASGLLAIKCRNDSSDYFHLCSNLGASLSEQLHLHKQNGRIDNSYSFKSMLTDSTTADDTNFVVKSYFENILASKNLICKRELAGTFGDSESLKSLLDLSVDYDGQFWNVLYGQYCHLFSVSASTLPTPVSPHLPNEDLCETVEQSIPFKPELYSQREPNGILGPKCFSSKAPATVLPAFDSEDKKKQGIGTYILNLNCHSNEERPSSATGMFSAPSCHCQFQGYTNNNDSATIQQEMTLSQEANHELSPEEYPALGPAKYGSCDTHQPYPSVWGSSAANGVSCRLERFESRSCSIELESERTAQDNALRELRTSCACGTSPSVMIPATQSVMAVLENQERAIIPS